MIKILSALIDELQCSAPCSKDRGCKYHQCYDFSESCFCAMRRKRTYDKLREEYDEIIDTFDGSSFSQTH